MKTIDQLLNNGTIGLFKAGSCAIRLFYYRNIIYVCTSKIKSKFYILLLT